MRIVTSVLLAVIAAGAATLAGSAPAAAYDYPWCVAGQGRRHSWRLFLCRATPSAMASASGRAVYCNINPRAAYGRQLPRRGRYYRDCYNE